MDGLDKGKMEAFEKIFVRNTYGINIVKCCASCIHRASKGDEKIRHCQKGRGDHLLDYYCGADWEMEPSLDKAGKGGGKVKKREYLDYAMRFGHAAAEDWARRNGGKYLTKR